jgi:DNA-directed RNA polymerase subunit RPC12/RpoP
MGRVCYECDEFLSCSAFSRNQWMKGEGYSRCRDCVEGYSAPRVVHYACQVCDRNFANQNELNMHMQVHRPRNVSCPVCGETRFRSGANAVQHVESGYCTGCRGADNARQQIYNFASKQNSMQRFMSDVPRLTYDGHNNNAVPDLPYHCPECNKSFRQMSQLLQHRDNKHGNPHLLTYN